MADNASRHPEPSADTATPKGEPATKRRRLSHGQAAIHTRIADPESALEVDIMILDYQAYQTINAVLVHLDDHEQHTQHASLDHHLTMTDAFLATFKARHPTYHADPALRFRLLLLQLCTLYTQRLTHNASVPDLPTLKTLRQVHHRRARDWIAHRDRQPSVGHDTSALDADLPAATARLERNRAHVLHVLGAPPEDEHYEDAFYGTSACVSLLDLVPSFVRVCAAINHINNSNLTPRLMGLLADLMLHACLEQYLICGTDGSDAIDEAFAWGPREPLDAAEGVELDEVDAVFEDESQAAAWAAIKAERLDELLPRVGEQQSPSLASTVAHLERVAAAYPIREFDAMVRDYLANLTECIPAPVLVQLERGRLDRFTVDETREFLKRCGVVSDVGR